MHRILLVLAILALSGCGRPNFHAGLTGTNESSGLRLDGPPGPSGAGTTVGQDVTPGGAGGPGGGAGGGGTTGGNPDLIGIEANATNPATAVQKLSLCLNKVFYVVTGGTAKDPTLTRMTGSFSDITLNLDRGTLGFTVQTALEVTITNPTFQLADGCSFDSGRTTVSAALENGYGASSTRLPMSLKVIGSAQKSTFALRQSLLIDLSPAMNRLGTVNPVLGDPGAQIVDAIQGPVNMMYSYFTLGK